MDPLALQDATALAAAVRAKTVSSRELLDLFITRIDALNPLINAVVTLDIDRARDTAAASDERAARGEWDGPLHGLPITVKDAIATEGLLSTGGAFELVTHVPAADAPAVAQLKQAGAIVFGKTNLPRWSGDIQSHNEIFGTTNNPWDLQRTPGGSSGGAAAAVASGLTSFELGTDIGGSVRIPANWCGVFGHKPSFGLVPQRGYLDHVGGGSTDPDINVFGPIARSVRDLERLLGVLAGPVPDAAAAWQVSLPPPRGDSPAAFRVGTWFDDPSVPIDPEVADLLQQAAAALTKTGMAVDASRPPYPLADAIALFFGLVMPAVSLSLPGELGEERGGSHRRWLELNKDRARMRATTATWFQSHDILLCPVMPMPAFLHDQTPLPERTVEVDGARYPVMQTLAWTGLVGVNYLPSTVVPIGRTAAGLPVGIQVVGPYLEDRTALAVAAYLAEELGGFEPPPLATGV